MKISSGSGVGAAVGFVLGVKIMRGIAASWWTA
jgi:hypothetical protein